MNKETIYAQYETIWREFEAAIASGEHCDRLRQLAFCWKMIVDQDLMIAELRAEVSKYEASSVQKMNTQEKKTFKIKSLLKM